MYGELEGGYAHYWSELSGTSSLNGVGLGASPGLAEFISPTVSWELGLAYRRSFYFESRQLGQVAFIFGFQVYLHRDKE